MDSGAITLTKKLVLISAVILCLSISGCAKPHLAPVVNGWRTTAGERGLYTVQPGDTLYSIAWEFGVDYRYLARINHLTYPYRIHRGQKLSMRGGGACSYKRPAVSKISRRAVRLRTIEERGRKVRRWVWPAHGKIIKRFSRRVGGDRGIDIAGYYGKPIVSAASGLVVYAGTGLRAYGKLIIIKHNASYLSAYAYNARILVKEGQMVRLGQRIATMGRDNSRRAVLHFELRVNGKPVDPLRYLR